MMLIWYQLNNIIWDTPLGKWHIKVCLNPSSSTTQHRENMISNPSTHTPISLGLRSDTMTPIGNRGFQMPLMIRCFHRLRIQLDVSNPNRNSFPEWLKIRFFYKNLLNLINQCLETHKADKFIDLLLF